MLRRTLIAASVLALAAGPALAAESGKEKGKSDQVGQYVDLSPVALPVVVDGRVINYVFAQVRINLSTSALPATWRAREPFFRDALIRAGHRTPFTNPSDYTVLDTARLQATLYKEAVAIAGAKEVKSVTVMSQTAKKRTGLPRPKTQAKPAVASAHS